jgi:NAD+ synthase (glutamine-hydrolysing)
MIVASCPVNQTPLDWAGNVGRILKASTQAREKGASLVLFPELCVSGYGCEDYFLMPWLYEEAIIRLERDIVPASTGILMAVGVPVSFQGFHYNTLAICIDGRLHGFYAKQILANEGVFYESRWFKPWPSNKTMDMPGKLGVLFGDFTVNFNGMEVGFEICEDAWHPDERPAVTGGARYADLIINASASNFAIGKLADRHHVVETLEGRNEAWYLYANLLGNESGSLIFDGEVILGKAGKVLASSPILGMEEFRVEVFELDENRMDWPGALIEQSDFEEFTAAACLGLKDYLRKSGSRGFTISLSGGADSSVCAVLVAEMLKRGLKNLGKDELERQLGFNLGDDPHPISKILSCVYQACENSGSTTLNAAEKLASELGAEFYYWDLRELVNGFTSMVEESIQQKLDWKTDDLCLQNIQARTRAPGIWMLANVRRHLLITTSNRSEGDVGYCTMDGDTAGSLAPIAGVSKHFIRQWLVWAKENLGIESLDLVIAQAPSAELRPTAQTDEGDLMPYDLLLEIEQLFLREKVSPSRIPDLLSNRRNESLEYLRSCTEKFLSMWKRNQWKRERMAPSFHLDNFNIVPRSMGRFPIFSA